MKKLSDYKDEAAIDLWADIIEIASPIVGDEEIRKIAQDEKKSNLELAKEMVKRHKKEVCGILLAIDDTPINGINVLTRLIGLINEIGETPEVADFFGFSGQNEIEDSSGSATGNTKAQKK